MILIRPGWKALSTAVVAVVTVALATGSAGLAAGSAAGRGAKAPWIVSAVMQDSDGNFLADAVRLTYSVRIRHAADADGNYPFAVGGYGIRSVGAASGKTLVIELTEGTQPDPAGQPTIDGPPRPLFRRLEL